MRRLPTRQVHLDFHTSEDIPGVGSKFSKENFQQALKLGHLNSITVFAKGHHGWCYYPSKVDRQHPTMEKGFDLTGAMIDAAHEIGVDCPVYITGGWSAKDAREHPEWAMLNKDGTPQLTNIDPGASPDDPRPTCSWVKLCLNGDGPYAEFIYRITQEVCDRYDDLDGLFFDIVYQSDVCYCPNCVAGMRRMGLDPEKEEDAKKYFIHSHVRFADRCTEILHKKHPEATIFFNSGGAEIYRPEYHASQTHYEMEDLPTTWGGYDKMPPRASVMSRYGKDYLGMTGKFHTSWGEFGGYKNPDALRYETALMGMYGAGCSVGDQMPPSGKMDLSTYRLIGRAYEYYEKIEKWCIGAKPTTRLGVYLSRDDDADEGLHRMLLEKHLDFEVVLPGDDLSRYDALILPDCVKLSNEEAARIQKFADNGGGVLLTGESAVKDGRFQLDTGLVYEGQSSCDVDYLKAGAELTGCDWLDSPFLCYRSAVRTGVQDAEVLGEVYEPWFNRTYAHYCSHQFTPYREEAAEYPGIARKGNIVYLAHKLCGMYRKDGAQLFRDTLCGALSLIYKPVMTVQLPSAGRARLTQLNGGYVLHLAYGSPIQRGRTSVIEDLPPIYNVPVSLRVEKKIGKVLLQPAGEALAFEQKDGAVRFTVPKVECHQIAELIPAE